MKNWQFCMLIASIYAAPVQTHAVSLAAVAVFLVGSMFELVRERK